MDDQRDYAEERANLLLLHEECKGCEVCEPDDPDMERKAREQYEIDAYEDRMDRAVELHNYLVGAQPSTKLDNYDRGDIIDELLNLLNGCTWDTKY